MKVCSFTALVLLVLLFSPAAGRAQDPLFSQTFASPTLLNPALTGLFPGRYRVAISHRSQWGQVMESPFSTSAFAADFHYDFNPKRRGSDGFGAGVVFLNDRMAEVGLSLNQVLVGGAFHKRLDARGEETLSAGVQGGIGQRSIGYGELTFEDQFDGTTGYVPGTGGELLPENSVSFGDFQLGINYSKVPQSRTAIFAGASIHHLTRPEQSFYATATAGTDLEITNTLYSRYSAYLNFRIPLNINTQLSPRVYYAIQGPHAIAQLGSNLRLLLDDSNGTALHFGLHARAAAGDDGYRIDSGVAFTGLEVSDFLFGFSYDGGLGESGGGDNRHRSAFEISASFIGFSEDDAAVPCPKF